MNTNHHWYGKKHTEETKRKISESRKRFYKNGGHSSFYGKPHTEEIKRKIALSRMGEKNWAKRPDVRKKISESKKGLWDKEKNPNWVGGKKKYWKKQAKIRDNYTCQKCGLYDPKIVDADRIKPEYKFPELALDLNNIITLCPNCHKRKTLRDRKKYPIKWRNQFSK